MRTLTLTFALSLLLGGAPAYAQGPFIVVPLRTPGTDPSALGAALERALAASGERVLSGEDAAMRFELVHSTDAATVAPGDIERWASRSRAALRHLARAEYQDARRALLQAQQISERAAEAMNREAARARGVLDTCLMVVRTQLETGDEPAAREQARACRRLVPRMQATAYTHPPEVRELLARVDAESGVELGGLLRVESVPSGCAVRVNGVPFGTTPVATNELGAGEYRVQVECREDVPGRVRRVTVGPTDVFVRVDARFDEALRSRGGIGLAYDGPASAERHAIADAGALSSMLGAQILLLRITLEGALRLDAVSPSGVRTLEASREDVVERPELVVARLAEARSTSADPSARGDASASLEPRAPRSRLRARLGFGLLALGGAALVTSVGLEAGREQRGEHYLVARPEDVDFLDRQQAWAALRTPMILLGLSGAAIASTSVVVLARPHRRLPWWGWLIGVAGVGFGTGAIVSSVGLPACTNDAQSARGCVERQTGIDRAVLLASLASPLLTTPLALRLRRDVSLSVAMEPGAVAFFLRGALQ